MEILHERSAQREQSVAQPTEAPDILVLHNKRGNAIDDVLKELEVSYIGCTDYVAEDDKER